MVLQMADKTRVYSKGIIKYMLIKVGKLISHAVFIIPNYGADDRVPIILRHPFLVTGGTLIDLRESTLKM